MFDFKYLKERFVEYVSLEKFQNSASDDYTDFDIYYGDSGMRVESFSMSKKEMRDNLTKALKKNLSEVLDICEWDVKFSHSSGGTIYVDVSFDDESTHWSRLHIKPIDHANETTMSEGEALMRWWE